MSIYCFKLPTPKLIFQIKIKFINVYINNYDFFSSICILWRFLFSILFLLFKRAKFLIYSLFFREKKEEKNLDLNITHYNVII